MKFLCQLFNCKTETIYVDRVVEKIVYQDRPVEKIIEKIVYKEVPTEKIEAFLRPNRIPKPEVTGTPQEKLVKVNAYYSIPRKPETWTNLAQINDEYVDALICVVDALQTKTLQFFNRYPEQKEFQYYTAGTSTARLKQVLNNIQTMSFLDCVQTALSLETSFCKCQKSLTHLKE